MLSILALVFLGQTNFANFLTADRFLSQAQYQKYTTHLTGSSVDVEYCEFSHCAASVRGGAISISGDTALVKHCAFLFCSSTAHGGAIYASVSAATLTANCYTACYTSSHANSVFGCSFALFHATSTVEWASVYHCSYTEDLSGDSSWCIASGAETHFSFINTTSSYNKYGATALNSMIPMVPGSTAPPPIQLVTISLRATDTRDRSPTLLWWLPLLTTTSGNRGHRSTPFPTSSLWGATIRP